MCDGKSGRKCRVLLLESGLSRPWTGCWQVKDHARQLLEKYVGKPFLDPEQARYGDEGSRMGAEDVEEGLAWLDDRFHVIRYEDDELPSVDWVLDLARAAVLRQVFCTSVGVTVKHAGPGVHCMRP